jgi:hypothetical protein
MAILPSARASLSQTGSGVGVNVDLMAIFSCTSTGTAGVARYITRVQDAVDEFGDGEGIDLFSHNVERNRQAGLLVKMATATPGAIGPVDSSGITGTCAITLTGTPVDDEEFQLIVVNGGTTGTAGITFKYSRDSGRSFSGIMRLGTALTFPVPSSGLTATFATGRTLNAGDKFVAWCVAPRWDAAGIAAGFEALRVQGRQPRIIVVCGDVDDSSDVQNVIDEISAYETESKRHSVVFCSARDRFAPAKLQKTRAAMMGAPSDVDFDATADTITRNTGSWIQDGFVVGQSIVIDGTASNDATHVLTNVSATVLTVGASPGIVNESNVNGADVTITGVGPGDIDFAASGFTVTRNIGSFVSDGFRVGMVVTVAGSASNNGVIGPLTAVSATVLTFASGIANEASVSAANLTITAVESKLAWRTAIDAIVGATPQTEKVDFRVMTYGGRAHRKSPLNAWRKMRPSSWAVAIRCMGHDIHISPAKVELGALDGWSIFDSRGELLSHDERVDGVMLSARVSCLTTIDNLNGVYCALPVTLDSDGRPLSRLPIVLVGQLTCRVAQAAYQQKLSSEVDYKSDGSGHILETEARRIDGYVNSQLAIALLSPGPEGSRATRAVATMTRNIDLRVVGATVPWEVELQCKAYIESLDGVVRVGG